MMTWDVSTTPEPTYTSCILKKEQSWIMTLQKAVVDKAQEIITIIIGYDP